MPMPYGAPVQPPVPGAEKEGEGETSSDDEALSAVFVGC